MDITIRVEGVERLRRSLGAEFSPARMTRLAEAIGYDAQEMTADHMARASVDRHKTADRLGAVHTKFLEFSPGRTRSASPRGGFTMSKDADPTGVTVVVGNTPGLSRAYHDLTIKPGAGKKYLTIPTHADAYGRKAKEFKNQGRRLFVLASKSGNLSLFEKQGKNIVRMYALVKSVTVPKDEGLLPTAKDYQEWAEETAEAFLRLYRNRPEV